MDGSIKRVAAGRGGDCVLIQGSEKTAVVDTGMAYCGQRLVEIIEVELNGKSLDYVLLSHSHYDHSGGIPYLREKWSKLSVLGADHAQQVFRKESAQTMIRSLSEAAKKQYSRQDNGPSRYKLDYRQEDLRVDQVIGEGDVVSLGDQSVLVLDTPGHTNCSLSFLLREKSIMFPCESIGCYMGSGQMASPILTSFHGTIASIEKCRSYHPHTIISPHYGEVRGISCDEYFDLARQGAERVRNFIQSCHRQGLDEQHILERCIDYFWKRQGKVKDEQPLSAFTINMEATIKVMLKEEEEG